MKRFTNTVASLVLAMSLFTSCQENLSEDLGENEILSELADNLDLSSEEITSAAENMEISYAITVLEEDNSEVEITNDAALKEYGTKSKRPRIKFPIEITVDGETITVNNKKELRALIGKKKGHRPPPFELVFPVTVTTDTGDQIIADKEAFKTYKDGLEKGSHPAFVFPISIIIDDETIVINSEEELKAAIADAKPDHGNRPARPELVFPLSVNTADGVLEIADKEAMKTYIDSLEEGTHPDFVFPISVIINDETIVVNNEEELKALKPKKGDRPERPELVFPLSVNTADGVLEIADKEAMKTYIDSLEEGAHPDFVFPISVIIDDETVVVNSEEELKALKPKKGDRPARPELVFPLSVTTADGVLEIADKEAMKSYIDTLEKGTHPAFVFPISLIIDDETVIANNEEELKALMPKKRDKK